MGFNIGVSSAERENNFECSHFIDRAFYNFVNEGEMYGDESILIKSGEFYGLDLSALLKIVYTWDGVTKEDIISNSQNVQDLLNLMVTFRNNIQNNNTVCDKIEYVWYDRDVNLSQTEIEELIEQIGEELAKPFLESKTKQKKEIEENPNPWKWYFDQGQIIDDLNNLIKSLECYKDKGVVTIYLTAG